MTRARYYIVISQSEERIRRYFRRYARDSEELADLTQEAIAALLDAYKRYKANCKMTTWIYSVCRNVYRKHVYYQVRNRAIDEMVKRNYQVMSSQSSELTERLHIELILESLKEEDRQLYRLYYVERRSVVEIASSLRCAPGTVKWLLFRLRQRIRDAIEQTNG